ncbi:hypothetical protein ACH5AO_24160 [Streptomyces sp. NPDC018964]|uniref:hypothetical protein n=1 Tax=Streptomyces sp. NPDC018964 TaxID=3365058 RepID=UPI0037AFC67A
MATDAPHRRPALMPDLERSRAVVVACDHDAVRPPEVQSTAGAVKLAEALTSPRTGPSFLPEHLTLLTSWTDPAEVVDAVRRAAEEASDVLLFHYVGTGRRHDEVVLPRRVEDEGEASPLLTAAETVRNAPAARKVLLLDCEGFGTVWDRLHRDRGGDGPSRTGDTLSVMGKSPSQYFELHGDKVPAGDNFTLALAGALDSGVDGGPELLDLPTLHNAIEAYWVQMRYYVENEYIGAPSTLGLEAGRPVALGRNVALGPDGERRGGFPAHPDVVDARERWWDE